MALFIFVLSAVCVAVSAAPPASPRIFQQQSAQLQQINPLDYYLDHPELHNYYSEQQKQKQAASQSQPSRLETLEPDSEVELIPGAQPPQQPPQQQPPQNVPGLIPGQRVFIIHMPIPGVRPGTIGGYQPVYIVATGPQGNPAGFPGNGYQNAVLVNQPNQGVPLGYPGVVQGYPGLVQGSPLIFGPHHQLSRPYDLIYQDPAAFLRAVPAASQGADNSRTPVRLVQLVSLQHPAIPQSSEATSAEPKQPNQAVTENKEARNLRTTSAHAQARPKP